MIVAVILSGCGVFDGSEIHEAVSLLVHLSRAGADVECFAPDLAQVRVVNHLTHKPELGQARNVLIESARIARGKIHPLTELDPARFDAVFFPGGFGAATNLCDFAARGPDMTLNPQIEKVIHAFHAARKPIGLCCIAPVLAARALGARAGGPGVEVTIGSDPATAAAIAGMGAINVPRPVNASHTDPRNRVVTTPAYMYDARPHEVFDGIGSMVESVLSLVRDAARSPVGARP